ncbi:uncharacterized protein J7T54_006558 [Emericellopsis cladophorae]|uniref:Transcription factor domain-containing protein n=1 Tax=Emericellopsis cladophorae TaxID=2686198 RepID=A0A9P9Y6K1_9HYPO|nr:uncharacterized protein J7T54_006558 [Emericellopsis cladophorae]KAI6784513.1 hypothetical protein J7T54_006558 [Emericellopsis cladophorae]
MLFTPANGLSTSIPGSRVGSDNGNAMYFQSNVHNHSVVQTDMMQTAPSASEASLAVNHGTAFHHQVVEGTPPPRKLENPFRKCRGTFGSFKLNPRFRLTKSRQHGYIKYENPRLPAGSSSQEVTGPIARQKPWGIDNSRRRAVSTIHEANSSDSDGSEVEELDHPEACTRSDDTLRQLEQDHRDAAALALSRNGMTSAEAADGENLRKSVQRSLGLIQVSTNPMTRRMLERGSPDELVFFAFYCRNWLPGRSTLGADNVWQEDFLLLGQNRYVYHAFMSIPAVHILDMIPSRRSLGLANYLLEEANKGIDASFEQYNSGQLLSSTQLDCTLTTLIALVIQDTNLPERRRKMRDHCPWLDALYCCEQLLERHNPHAGYYNPENVQMSSLRAAQCKLVARGIITAETMLPFEPALQYSTYDGSKASSRFRWLRYGNIKDRHQIQGGVGMCRRLLELMRQITLWSGAMSQSDASGGNMLQVENIMNCLEDMRQWAPNFLTWDEAKEGPPTKVWVDSHFAGLEPKSTHNAGCSGCQEIIQTF